MALRPTRTHEPKDSIEDKGGPNVESNSMVRFGMN